MSAAPLLDRLYAYDDLAAMPDDGNRYEIINGELIVSPAPIMIHQSVQGALFFFLYGYVARNKLGEVFATATDVRFSQFDVVQPDIVVLARDRVNRMQKNLIVGAPTLVVEILSTSTRRVDTIKKQALYASHGVEEYWIVDPVQRTIEVLTLDDGKYIRFAKIDGLHDPSSRIQSSAFPELKFLMSDIFWGAAFDS